MGSGRARLAVVRRRPLGGGRPVATDTLPFQARFGGAASRGHELAIRLVPVGFEQVIRVHLLAPAGQEDWSVVDVLVWNASLNRLEWVDRAGLARMGGQLDPALGLARVGLVGLGGVITGVLQLLAAVAAPGIVIVGSLGFVLFLLTAYYILVFTVAKVLLLYVVLPAAGLAGVCELVKQFRLQRFEEAVLGAARSAVDRHYGSGGAPC